MIWNKALKNIAFAFLTKQPILFCCVFYQHVGCIVYIITYNKYIQYVSIVYNKYAIVIQLSVFVRLLRK